MTSFFHRVEIVAANRCLAAAIVLLFASFTGHSHAALSDVRPAFEQLRSAIGACVGLEDRLQTRECLGLTTSTQPTLVSDFWSDVIVPNGLDANRALSRFWFGNQSKNNTNNFGLKVHASFFTSSGKLRRNAQAIQRKLDQRFKQLERILNRSLPDDPDPGPEVSILASSSPSEIVIEVGESIGLSTAVSFSTSETDSFTVSVVQTVSPEAGLTVSPDVGSGFTASADFSTVDNQLLAAGMAGTYQIKTVATIVETGDTSESIVDVTVVAEGSTSFVLLQPGAIPSSIPTDILTDVLFTVATTGSVGANPPSTLNLSEQNNSLPPIVLNDLGENGDAIAADGTYSGIAGISASGLPAETCFMLAVNSPMPGSPALELCTTDVPVEATPSDLDPINLIADSVTDDNAIANEIIVFFADDTPEASMFALAASVGGAIDGGIPELNLFKVLLDEPAESIEALNAIVDTLNADPIVVEASINSAQAIGLAVTPNDPRFGTQTALTVVRADEAWTIARGGSLIAVIDSGVDYTHPDLGLPGCMPSAGASCGKVILGPDLANGDDDPFDDNGHGTHVAGIAAASSDNGIGVAGVAWDSKIYAVKVSISSSIAGAFSVAQGIVNAANRGARVINLSLGWHTLPWRLITCPAVSYAAAKGSFVVAAAGNNGNSSQLYPAACGSALAVGNTLNNDARAASSNFGSWVEIAAPGTGIVSTVPTGTCSSCDPSGYAALTGTSMSSPLVAGAAAVALSRDPGLSNSQLRDRLKRTAVELPGLQLGAGRVDLFEAVFNGSFEEGSLALWTQVGTASSLPSLASIVPQHRKRMGFVSTGPAGAEISGALRQNFVIQPGVTSFPITFSFAFVTEEFPEFVGTQFDDILRVSLITPSGATITLATESVNASAFSPISGIDFPGGDTTVGWTGWITVSTTIGVTDGPGTYEILLEDTGDAIFDSAAVIDDIQFR